MELSIGRDVSAAAAHPDGQPVDDERVERWTLRSRLRSPRGGGERQRGEPRTRSALDDHHVQAPASVFGAPAERGELELALADADEHQRRHVRAQLPFDLDLDGEHTWADQQANAGDDAREPIAEEALEALAQPDEGDVAADRARVEEEMIVHDACIDRSGLAGKSEAQRVVDFVRNAEVGREVVE